MEGEEGGRGGREGKERGIKGGGGRGGRGGREGGRERGTEAMDSTDLYPHTCLSVLVCVHDKQNKANTCIYTQDSFLLLQRKNCPGWDSTPRHSTF